MTVLPSPRESLLLGKPREYDPAILAIASSHSHTFFIPIFTSPGSFRLSFSGLEFQQMSP